MITVGEIRCMMCEWIAKYNTLHPSGRPAGLVVLHPFQPAHHPLLLLLIITEAHDDIDTNVCNCI